MARSRRMAEDVQLSFFDTASRMHDVDELSNVFVIASRTTGRNRATEEIGVRPRQFVQEDVLRIAFEQFWRKGVRGTSLSDIARDAGVQRGSLYNAFGSKEALFLCAYERYANDYLATVEKAVSKGPLRKRLVGFFDVAIANFCKGSPPRGCPTTRGLMEISSVEGDGLDETARQAFASLLTRVVELIEGALRAGVACGDFRGDPEITALHIVTIARGLVVLERAFGDEAQLRRIARYTVDTVLRSK